jgi:hypothetical protein
MDRSVISAAVLFAFAHTLVCSQAFNTRSDYLNLHGSEVGWAIEKTPWGYLAFQGYSPDTVPGASVGFTSLDQTGVVLDSWSFGWDSVSTTPGWANSLDRASDSGFFSCGAANPSGINHAMVWRFGSDGDSLWSAQLFNDTGYVSFGWMAKGLEGGSVIAVGTVHAPNQNSDIFLVKLTADGQVVWTRTFGTGQIDKGYSVDLMPDGGFIIGGYTTAFGNGGHETYVIRTDSAGNQIWHRWFGGAEDDCIANVTVAANGDILVAGCEVMYVLGNLPYFRSQLIRLSPDGDVIWNNLYGPTDVIDGRWCVKESSDGGLIAPGTIAGVSGYPQGSLLKVAANGDSLWMRSYSHPSVTGWLDWHELRDIVIEPDDGVTACGFLVDSTNQDLWVIRVDNFGCLVPDCQLYDHIAALGIDLNVLMYPNPTHDKVFISFRSAVDPSGEFVLMNSAGQIIQRFQPGSRSVEIDLDIGYHPAGLYIVQYRDDGGIRWSGKLLKE